MGPWARCLEALCHLTVSQAKVPDISNHIRELVPLNSIFGTSRNAFIFVGNVQHLFHSNLNVIFLTFEKAGGSAHFIYLETHNLEQELFLYLVNDLLSFAFLCGLDGLAKLKLNVIKQAERRWVNSLL